MAKISISIPDELLEQVLAEAGAGGVSAWLSETAQQRLRNQAMIDLADEIAMQTGGPFTEQELARADALLGLSSTQARS